MHYRLIDVSGGVSPAQVEAAIQDCKVGDVVIAFDHRAHPLGQMPSTMAALREKLMVLVPGGGTDVRPALDLVKQQVTENSYVTIYTDGFMPPFDTSQPKGGGLKYIIALYPNIGEGEIRYARETFGKLPATQVRAL